MSARQTSKDNDGYKRGQKGYGKPEADDGFWKSSDYKKELFYKDAVGQRAQVGDLDKEKQRGY